MSKRIACFLAAVALIVASAVPAYAVTPQEGWFISGTMERDGINYYIIDNKVNDAKWWLNLRGGSLRFNDTYESGEEDTAGNLNGVMEGINGYAYYPEAYHGFSETDWRIDNDWLLEVSVDSYKIQTYRSSGTIYTQENSGSFMICAFDRSALPTITAKFSSYDAANNMREAFSISQDVVNAFPISGTTKVAGPAVNDLGTYYYPISNFQISGLFSGADTWDGFGMIGEEGFGSYDLDACSINDLILFPLVSDPTDEYGSLVDARVAFRFLCPVDKAPSGMAVGDRWPKVWPLEVEILEAYKEYYDRMLANGEIFSPDDVDTSFGQLNQLKDSWLDSFDSVPSSAVSFASSTFDIFGSAFIDFFVPILFGCLLLVFINKAVH